MWPVCRESLPSPDKLQINGRNASDTSFETMFVFQRLGADGNIGFRTTSQFGKGQSVMAIANASVAPSANPAGGGILYVEDGALKYRGSNGTVTVIAPANDDDVAGSLDQRLTDKTQAWWHV